MLLVAFDVCIDFCHKIFNAAEGATSNRLLGNSVEPNLHLVQPRGISWREMDLITRMPSQPAFDRWMLVRGVVIDDEMDIKLCRDIGVDLLKKAEILLMSVPTLARGHHIAGCDVQCRKECRGTVADVIVGDPFGIAQSHGKHRLCTVEGLEIWLFSSTQSTIALSGGLRYMPTISRTFSIKKGSVDSWKCRRRCG